MKSTDSTPEELLVTSKIDALVVTINERDRPVRGLASRIDWRFRGAIESFLRSGAISGQVGECVLLPVHREGLSQTEAPYRLLLVGTGETKEGHGLPAESLNLLKKNIERLGIKKLAASRADLGDSTEILAKAFPSSKGIELWIAP